MRTIDARQVSDRVAKLCLKANIELRPDIEAALLAAFRRETTAAAKKVLRAILDNARIARERKLPICQDTGMACVFIEIGNEVHVRGDLAAAVEEGVTAGYRAGHFRPSIVRDPLARGRSAHAPANLHVEPVKGDTLRITVMPKGFGSENKSQLKMFNPTAAWTDIAAFIIEAVKAAGPDACPPYVVGVGIGGTAEVACYLAKKALLRPVTRPKAGKVSGLLKAINALGIGPMGLGGKTTALAVHVETAPTHIAGLPVAVNIGCHATRSATAAL